MSGSEDGKVLKLANCRILRDHQIIVDDLWIRNGKIINPEPLFFEEKRNADLTLDCRGVLIAPGYIDLQINGGFGYDFSDGSIDANKAITEVARGILKHGVTSFCPTIITQSKEFYRETLPKIKRSQGGKANGASNLGVHLEGPFISHEKRGAHPVELVQHTPISRIDCVTQFYGHLEDAAIITLAPELDKADLIKNLTNRGIVVSIGHSMGTLSDGERAAKDGANFITHLFNAMLPFHHRDPGLVGLLTSKNIVNPTIHFGIIADGIHTHEAALNIAFRSNPHGLVLVTDAISAMGLPEGAVHKIGTQTIQISGNKAFVHGTNTLCGSIATMDECVRNFKAMTQCTLVQALECAALHPARVLGLANKKGTLNFGSDADFIFLNEDLKVVATFIGGECVWHAPDFSLNAKII